MLCSFFHAFYEVVHPSSFILAFRNISFTEIPMYFYRLIECYKRLLIHCEYNLKHTFSKFCECLVFHNHRSLYRTGSMTA